MSSKTQHWPAIYTTRRPALAWHVEHPLTDLDETTIDTLVDGYGQYAGHETHRLVRQAPDGPVAYFGVEIPGRSDYFDGPAGAFDLLLHPPYAEGPPCNPSDPERHVVVCAVGRMEQQYTPGWLTNVAHTPGVEVSMRGKIHRSRRGLEWRGVTRVAFEGATAGGVLDAADRCRNALKPRRIDLQIMRYQEAAYSEFAPGARPATTVYFRRMPLWLYAAAAPQAVPA